MQNKKPSKLSPYSQIALVKEYISKNEIRTAISKLIEVVVFNAGALRANDYDYHSSLITLSARFNKIEKDRFLGLIGYEQYTEQLSKIIYALMNLINGLEKEKIRFPEIYHEDNYHAFVYYNYSSFKTIELVENFFFDVGLVFFHGMGSDKLVKLSKKNDNKIILFLSKEFIYDNRNLTFLFDLLSLKERAVNIFIIILNDLRRLTTVDILELIKGRVRASIELSSNLEFKIEEKDTIKFFTKLNALFDSNNVFKYDDLKKRNYFPILKLLGYKDLQTLERCLSIFYTINEEKQNSEMIAEILNNPGNKISMITRAKILIKRKQYLEARTIFNHLINQQPNYAISYFCLAELLIDQYKNEFHDLHIAKGYIYKARDKYEVDSSFTSRFDKLYNYLILEKRKENYL